jgi:basic amino acid/polyamine antiporter, APA family
VTETKRPLGSITLLALGVNGIVGVGIFVAPPTVARAFPGASGALIYPAIAIACLPVALAYARLSRAFPTDGGPALYAAQAFGARVAGAIGSLVWVSALFSSAAVTRALCDRIGGGFAAMLAVALSIVLALVNLRGLKLSAWTWTVLTVAKLTPLLALATLGMFAPAREPINVASASRGAALLAVMFSLQGFEIVPLPAGQARDPERTVPRATVASLILAGVLYGLVHLACTRALPLLASAKSAIPEASLVLGGPQMSRAIVAGVLASMGGIVIGMHAMTPRYLAALTHERAAEVPTRSIVVTAIIIALLCFFSSMPELVNMSSIAVLAQYGTTAIALAVLASRRQGGLAPPDAWPVPFALAVVVILLAQASVREASIAAAVALAGIILSRLLNASPSGPVLPR